MSFHNKNIAVIGASSGIGLAITRALSEQGARVWAYSRRPMPETLPGVQWSEADATSEVFYMENLPDQLHGAVYCPGSINLKPFHRISTEEFRKELEINIVGAFRALQQLYPALKSGQGSVVLFSTVAVQTGMNFHTGIAAAKGAIEGLTRALAAEWAPTIRVNAIAPSLTDTPLAEKLLNSEEKRQNAAARHPLRRVGTPEDLSQAALFLLSEQSSFVTGQIIAVDGGIGKLK